MTKGTATHATEEKQSDMVIQSEERPVVALFSVKRDIETKDDIGLAELEIEGLVGGPLVPIAGSGVGHLALSIASDNAGDPNRVLAAPVKVDDLSILRDRLAMSDRVYVDLPTGLEIVSTSQTFLESATSAGTRSAPEAGSLSRAKNSYLTHGFHKYKAKFFPRMARALTNHVGRSGVLGDPYMGSGTLGVEASLMGLDSAGVDIDPLSVFIANQKVGALAFPTDEFEEAFVRVKALLAGTDLMSVDVVPMHSYEPEALPEFIRRKTDHQSRVEIERDMALLKSALFAVDNPQARDLLMLALSHAISTKVSLRWMGTGDPRFSLTLAKRSLGSVFDSHARTMLERFRDRDRLLERGYLPAALGASSTVVGDARNLPWASSSLDGIVTSPPYIPASSGRETYLRSRAPSLVALGLLSEDEVLAREALMVGSIERSAPADAAGLPPSIQDLVEWMLPQRARKPKALPTAAYFLDIAASLREMGRVLKPNSRAAVVLSHQHVFYEASTREHVRTVVMPQVVEQLVSDPLNGINLSVERVHKIQLIKMDYAARPASTGDYAESIMILRRNN